MPNYTECLVTTLQAPDGFQFDTGRWKQQTVCEGSRWPSPSSARGHHRMRPG